MAVSVIIPAHNAAGTLAATLDSVRAQTHARWEAIIVDDGSSDGTAGLARHYARSDARFRLLRQRQRGEAGARNRGVSRARHEWLLFLDADDTIAPSHMERLLAAANGPESVDAAYCDWVRVAPDGTRGEIQRAPSPETLFAVSAHHCPFAIHACIVRRRLVERVGLFDAGLATCPDWDLWQRIARSGAPVIHVGEPLAYYWMRPSSAGGRAVQVLVDGWTVIERGHGPDTRVRDAARFRNGQDPALLVRAKSDFLCWIAGLVIGQGERADFLVNRMQTLAAPTVDPEVAAAALLGATLLPGCRTFAEWPAFWPSVRPRILDFLTGIEAVTRTPGLAAAVERRMQFCVQPGAATHAGRAADAPSRSRTADGSRDAFILLYHRVAELHHDPWQLAVTPRHFAEQLDVLKSWARPVPLAEIGAGASARGRRPVAITFDDGYADNLYEALPILQRKHVPATVFAAVSDAVGPDDFWWDQLASLVLERPVPRGLELGFDDSVLLLEPVIDAPPHDPAWRAWHPWRTPAQRFFIEAWTRLRVLDAGTRDAMMDSLFAQCGEDRRVQGHHRRLTHAELVRLAGAGIDIGAHTIGHSSLAALSVESQAVEIGGSRAMLEAITGVPVTSFSYPFGSASDYTGTTRDLVRAAGFARACTGIAGRITRRTDLFEMPRLIVPDLDGAGFEAWLLRKLAQVAAA